jgi:Ni/Co efflux regulator RcnB
MEHLMKKLLVIVALATVLTAPAFAQQASNARRDAQTSHQQWSVGVDRYSNVGRGPRRAGAACLTLLGTVARLWNWPPWPLSAKPAAAADMLWSL